MFLHCALSADKQAAMTKWVGAMLAVVGLIRLLLVENPLSEEAKPDADGPTQKGCPVVTDAASRSPPGSTCDMMIHSPHPQAEPVRTGCWQHASAASATPLAPKHSFLQVSMSDAMGMAAAPRWRNPTPAAWKQISSMAARAYTCLFHLNKAMQLPKVTAMEASALRAGLALLLYGLLQGHRKNVDLDFQDIPQQGVLPAVSLATSNQEMRHLFGPLVQLMLDRLATEALHGSWLQPPDDTPHAHEIVTPVMHLGT